MIIRSMAPLRISFAGGGTGVEPYVSDRGGCVLSTTIDKFAYATLRLTEERRLAVTSLDYDIIAKYDLDQPLSNDGDLDLVKAVIRRLGPDALERGMDFFLHCDAPPGSGLGSSSTMVVSLIGLFQHWLHLPLTHYEIADLTYQIERVDVAIRGGRQDQYAATFGGFDFNEIHRDAVIVNPLRIPVEVINELRYSMLLCYSGKTRRSARIIETQVAGYLQRQESVLGAMGQLKQIATDLKNSLLRQRLDDFGALLHEAWTHKKRMARQFTDPDIDEPYETARQHGALGGKITGAGGGGYMFFYCRFDKKHRVAEALEKQGAQIVNFNFERHGLQTWELR